MFSIRLAFRPFFAVALLVATAGGCSVETDPCGGAKLCVGLRVEGHRVDLDQLLIGIDNPQAKTARSPEEPSTTPIKLPAKVALHLAAGTSGAEDVSVTGLAHGVPVAYGHGSVQLDGGGHAQLTVTLSDDLPDFGTGGNGLDMACGRDLAVDPMNCGACGNVCASGSCGTVISASMAEIPPLWTFNHPAAGGGASYDGTNHVAILTQPAINQVGSIVYKHPIVADTMTAAFQMRIKWSPMDMSMAHADGMGFMLIKADGEANLDTALSTTAGSTLGMTMVHAAGSATTLTGYGVEFDTYESVYMNPNGLCGEPKGVGEHINIDSLDLCTDAPGSNLPTSLTTMPVKGYKLSDGNWHQVAVRLAQGTLSVWFDPANPADLSAQPPVVAAPLPNFHAGDAYYLAFSGATGSAFEEHAVRNVTITFDTPHCL